MVLPLANPLDHLGQNRPKHKEGYYADEPYKNQLQSIAIHFLEILKKLQAVSHQLSLGLLTADS